MARYRFSPPKRLEVPYGDDPLFSRVTYKVGSTVMQLLDGTWLEFEGDMPMLHEGSADYLFGLTDRKDIPKGKGFGVTQDGTGTNLATPSDYGYESPVRLYRGGRDYVIDDQLKSELENASTTQEPNGYGSYITSITDTGQRFGDELMISGYTTIHEHRATSSEPAVQVRKGGYTAHYGDRY